MAEHWQSLVANLAVVALFITAWVHIRFVVVGRHWVVRKAAFGVLTGCGAVASMLLAIQIDGMLFDLRWSLLAIAGFFGGPVGGIVAACIASAYRVGVVGGPTSLGAAIGIVLAVLTGLAVSRLTRVRLRGFWAGMILAVAVPIASLAFSFVWRYASGGGIAPALSLPVAFMNMMATMLSAFFIMRNRVVEKERDLLHAAFIESPDLQYVKLPDSRFAAVNMTVARRNGFTSPEQMIGKSDFDLTDRDRAAKLMEAEQALLKNGSRITDLEEMIVGPDGSKTWYLTSKVPLHDAAGQVIGLAGVTRDVTVRRKLRDEAEESRNQLNYVLAGMSDGIAMFDRFGVLVYCNEQYRTFFPLTQETRQPGRSIIDILRAVATTGEQKGIPAGLEDEWVEEVAATLDAPGEQEIQLCDARWLHVRTRPTAEGAALVVVSDVTKIKAAESALVSLTDQLKMLATTDGLTGLTNRRAFDQALENELARSRRTNSPLSLLMIDVDRFKAYNDLYGHQAGDAVLKTVGDCLRATVKRPTDVVARYGGEEFVVVLPATDEDGAFFIADELRENLRALNVAHKAADKGVLTISIGLATFTDRDAGMNAVELVRRADEALYNAKGAGRDRVTGWRPKSEIRPVGLAARH